MDGDDQWTAIILGLEVEEEEWRIALTELKEALCMVHIHIKYAECVRLYANVWRLIDFNKSVWVKRSTRYGCQKRL